MSVKVGRLFKDSRFNRFPDKVKLLYIYLATSPDLNTVGVFSPNIEVAQIETGLSLSQFKMACIELIQNKFLYTKKFNDVVYFIIPAHFATIPKSEATVTRVNKTLKSLPEGLVGFLATVGISTSSKVRTFVKPTAEEVSEYAMSLGHLIDGQEFVKSYEEYSKNFGKTNIWVDSRGTQVRDWKAKLRKIWFKDDNKVKTFADAPKGFESFYVNIGGQVITPDGWRNGKPFSKSLPVDIELKKQYEERKRNS